LKTAPERTTLNAVPVKVAPFMPRREGRAR
jgi:hypothetical protein